MKEIKYRAWDNVNDEMLYTGEDEEVLFIIGDGKIECTDVRYADEEWHEPNDTEHFVYMQYTRFKDIHGVKIYEGDIINHLYMLYVGHGEVDEVREIIEVEDITKLPFDASTLSAEVIGNIYENPELLEEADEKK